MRGRRVFETLLSEQNRLGVLHEHEIMLDYNYFQKVLQKLRKSLGTYLHKKDALQIGSGGLHLTNLISLRDTQGMEKDHKNCKVV